MDKKKSNKSTDNRYFWSEMSTNNYDEYNKNTKCSKCNKCNKCCKCNENCKKDEKCDKFNKYDNCDIVKYICCLLEQQKDSLKNTERILKLLTSSKYGLKEIKEEVSDIEDAVFSATFGLEEIKTEIAAIEEAVLSPTFGLEEIKTEIAAIEEAVLSPTFGLAEIKTEIAAIEEAVLSPTFGLEEIKTEIAAIEEAVLSPTFGLAEIKTEISAIEEAVLSPTFGLEEIKTEIAAIEEAVLSPTFGLEEIKTEIIQIIDILNDTTNGQDFTTGAFVLDNNANSIILNLLNRNGEPRTVTVNRFIFNPDGTINDTLTQDVTIDPNETATIILPISTDQDLSQIEIQLLGIGDGVYAWIGARTQDDNADEFPSNFIDSNVFTDQDLSPLVTP